MENLLRIRCVTACHGHNGPDFDFCVVELSQAQYEEGDHYEAAKIAASNHGYDVEKAVVYDTNDLRVTVGVEFHNHFAWETADLYNVGGIPLDVYNGTGRFLGSDL